MAGDKRFDTDSFDDDAVRDDVGDDAVGGGDGNDAAPGPLTTDAVSAAGSDAGADPIASELSAVFAAALADEPPSRVTAASVLREVYGEKSGVRGGFGAWLTSGPLSLKWAGGLAVAAALIGAVIVTAPNMVGSGADSAAVAGAQRYESAAGSVGSGSAGSLERSDAAADSADGAVSMATPEAAPMSGMSEMSASSESSQAAAGGYSAQSEAASGDAADGDTGGVAGGERQPGIDQRTVESSSEAPDTAAETSSGTDCSIPPLAPEAWAAAVAVLPRDVTTTRLAGASCAAGALRGNGIEIVRGGEQSGTFLWIVVSDAPIGRDGAATDSTVVSASRGDVTVTVIANQGGDPWLDESALQHLVDAVAAAS